MQKRESASVAERRKGNRFFESSKVDGLSYILRKTRLDSAMASYIRAENLASNSDEYASASKNHGKAAWNLYCLLKGKQEQQVQLLFYLKEATQFFCLSYGKRSSKSREWQCDLLTSLKLCMEELRDIYQNIDNVDEKCSIVSSFIQIVTVNHVYAELQINLAGFLFHDAVKLLQVKDYKGALRRLRDCYRPIEEAKMYDSENPDIRVLEQDVYFHTCSAESIQACECANQLLATATLEEESINFNLVWDVVDWYKQAAILTRELDLEQEAIALSHLGFVYNKVLKLKYRSKEYYKKCLELVESMKPRTFFTQDWYQRCVSTLQEFQMEERMRDEREKQKEREKKLEAVKEELDDLEKNNTGKCKFLIHVYNTYPPKNPKWKKPSEEEMKKWAEMEMKELKKVFHKATIAYHPDKIDAEDHGENWKLLCEEINKMLNRHYQEIKDEVP